MPSIADHEGWAFVDEASLVLPYSKAWIDYWRGQLDNDGKPRVDRFDPLVDIPTMVHCIGWIEVLHDDYLYRVMGTTIRDQLGIEFTGKRLSELDLGGFEVDTRNAFDSVRRDRDPRFMCGYYARDGRRDTSWEACILPILSADDIVTRILLGMAYSKRF